MSTVCHISNIVHSHYSNQRNVALPHCTSLIVLNETVRFAVFVSFCQLVSDGSIEMHSCEEGTIVFGVRQAGLIIVQGKLGPAWTEGRLLAVSNQLRWSDGPFMTQHRWMRRTYSEGEITITLQLFFFETLV